MTIEHIFAMREAGLIGNKGVAQRLSVLLNPLNSLPVRANAPWPEILKFDKTKAPK